MEKLLNYLSLPGEAKEYIEIGYLTENTGRDGKNYWWYMDNEKNACIDEEGNIIDDEAKIRELFE